MGMLFNNFLEEGYYEYDDFSGYTLVTDGSKKQELLENGKLFHSDGHGYGPEQVNGIDIK
jgi:hypothetical protein